MTLENEIIRIQQSLREGRFTSEAAVKQGIVLPILQVLGWPITDISIVIPEYTVAGRRVDYALCPPPRRQAKIFIEAKTIGNIEGGDQQLFEYAFHQGVPSLILTDGREWSFYLPGETGNYLERKVYKIDLLERDFQTIEAKFTRYLLYENVKQGLALENARNDLREITTRHDAEITIPQAWQSILHEHNDLLMELIIDKVEVICGIRPERESCELFLDSIIPTNIPLGPQQRIARINRHEENQQRNHSRIGYSYNGQNIQLQYARDVMIEIVKILSSRDPSFLERFETRAHGRTRNYISRDKMNLYPGRQDLCEEFSREIIPGWWIGLNYGRHQIEMIINMALEVAQMVRGRDIEYNLGNYPANQL